MSNFAETTFKLNNGFTINLFDWSAKFVVFVLNLRGGFIVNTIILLHDAIGRRK